MGRDEHAVVFVVGGVCVDYYRCGAADSEEGQEFESAASSKYLIWMLGTESNLREYRLCTLVHMQ
jgi:hypothetical protein